MKVMDKRIIISLPVKLYQDIKKVAQRHYISVAGFIRESAMERIEDEFTPKEMALLDNSRKSFRAGKGVNWRAVKRG